MSRLHTLLRAASIAVIAMCLVRSDDATARPRHHRARHGGHAHATRAHHHDADNADDADKSDNPDDSDDAGDNDAGERDRDDSGKDDSGKDDGGPGIDVQAGAGPDRSPSAEDGESDQTAGDANRGKAAPPVALAPVPNEGPVDKNGIPAVYRRTEIHDVTTGMREDTPWTLSVGRDGTVYVGTAEGRSYISHDEGTTWDESWIVPEVKQLFGYAGQTMLLGHIRGGGFQIPNFASLFPAQGYSFSQTARAQFWTLDPASGGGLVPVPNLPTLNGAAGGVGNSTAAVGGSQPGLFGSNGGVVSGGLSGANSTSASSFGMDSSYALNAGDVVSPLVTGDAARVQQAPGIVLGAGLSAGAPRLSVALNILHLPIFIAKLNLQRLLLYKAQHWTDVRRIRVDPQSRQHLLAGTHNGLYESFDGGVSWVRTFPGMTVPQRGILDVEFDQADPKRVYLGTEGGLFESDNGGLSWKLNTAVPEMQIKKIVIDPTDNNYVYFAGYGGVFRSSDRGATAIQSYYSTIPQLNDVQSMAIDPQNPNRALLGTGYGIMETTHLRTSTVKDWFDKNPARFQGLVIPVIRICPRHPRHIYAMTRADLPYINYGANGPEAYLLESWDDGEHWQMLATNRSQGDIRWFDLDPRDPDEPWVAFSRAIVQVKRVPPGRSETPVDLAVRALPGEPTIGEVVEHTLEHHRVDMGTYQHDLDSLRHALYLPDKFDVTFFAGRSGLGESLDDFQFAQDRYLVGFHYSEWRIMAFASWRLPTIVFYNKAVAMLRQRENVIDDQVRNQLMITVHRDYGELLRLEAQELAEKRTGKRSDLFTRAVRRVRIQRLEAVVDLASGGYLTKRRKKLRDAAKER